MFRTIATVTLIVVMTTFTAVRISPMLLTHDQQETFERGIMEVIRRTTGYVPRHGRYAQNEPVEQVLTRRGSRPANGVPTHSQANAEVQTPRVIALQPSFAAGVQYTKGTTAAPRTSGPKRIRVGE